MKNVYLIRHALPEFPGGKGMCIGTTDIPLGEKGYTQATEMAKTLPPVAAVFSSPLSRAVQTANAIGLPVTVLDDLREMHAGEWDGLTFDEIRERFPELYAARANDLTLPLPGAEDHKAALSRFRCAMLAAAEAASGDFAVVAHGGIIARFMEEISGSWYKPDYTEVITLHFENGIFTLQEEL